MNKIKTFIIILLFSTFSNYTYGQNIAYSNLDTVIKTSKTGKDIKKRNIQMQKGDVYSTHAEIDESISKFNYNLEHILRIV